jgi:hypothetical protein
MKKGMVLMKKTFMIYLTKEGKELINKGQLPKELKVKINENTFIRQK